MCVHLQMPVLVSLNCIQIRIHTCMYSCIYKLLFLGFVLNQHLICLCICMYVYMHLCNTLKREKKICVCFAPDQHCTCIHTFHMQLTATQHTATHCNTLQHTATHCNTLQHTATHCNALQHTATHCNTLQHTAPHCNTLHHTATHCNTHSLYTILLTKLLFPSVHMGTVYIYRHLLINIVSC